MHDLGHLPEELRPTALANDAERIALIRNQWWITYPRAQNALAMLSDALTDGPGRLRPPGFLLLGATNNGKSMIIEKFRRDNTPIRLIGEDQETIPVVVMQMATDPGVSRFYQRLLAVLGAPIRQTARKPDLETLALKLLRRVGTRILVIDELHNMLAGSNAAQREFLNLLRFLSNELRIPILGAGTRDAYLALRVDPQLENRFHPLLLPLWEDGPELAGLIESFVSTFPLRRPSNLQSGETLRTILARTEGTIGEIASLMRTAAVAAIESGDETISRQSLERAAYNGPTERRRLIEQVLS